MLLVLVAIGLCLRLLFLGRSGLWHDEIFTLYYSRFSPSFLWREGLRLETTPPLYYWLLHYWIRAFGEAPFLLRLPSALLSTATIWLVGLLGRRISGAKAGLWAAGLCAFCAFQLAYAQEVRGYALEAAAACVALIGLDLFVQTHFLDDAPSAGRRAKAVALYAGGCVVCLHAHITAAFLPPACCLGVLYAALQRRRLDARMLADWLGANFLIFALTAPVLVPMLTQVRSPVIAWIPRPDASWIGVVLSHLMLGNAFPVASGKILAVLALAALAVLAARDRLTLRERIAYAIVPGAFFALLLATSLVRPLLIDRTVLWLTVPICLMAGRLAAGLKNESLRRAFVALAVLLYGAGAWRFFRTETKEDLAGLSSGLRNSVDPSFTPVFCPCSAPYDIQQYAPELLRREPLRIASNPRGPLRWTDFVTGMSVRRTDYDELSRLIAAKTRMFLVVRNIDLESCGRRVAAMSRPPDETIASREVTAYVWR